MWVICAPLAVHCSRPWQNLGVWISPRGSGHRLFRLGRARCAAALCSIARVTESVTAVTCACDTRSHMLAYVPDGPARSCGRWIPVSGFKSVVVSAGVLIAASDALQGVTGGGKFSDQVVKPTYLAGSVLGLIGMLVLALALLALHARQADRAGRAGRAVAVATGFGIMLLAGVAWSTTFLDPAAAKVAPGFINNTPPAILVAAFFGSLAVFGLAWVAYSIVMLRSGVFARLPVILILIAALGSATPFVPFA